MADSGPPNAALQNVPMLQLLERDPRPSFVLDLDNEIKQSDATLMEPVFYNAQMREFPAVLDAIQGRFANDPSPWPKQASHGDFRTWALQCRQKDTAHASMTFTNLIWDSVTVAERWNVVSARTGTRSYSRLLKHASSGGTESEESYMTFKSSTKGQDESPGLSPFDDTESPAQSIRGVSKIINQYQQMAIELRQTKEELTKKVDLLDRIAKMDSVGIYIVDGEGEIEWCNDAWYEKTNHPRGVSSALSWMNCFVTEDIPRAMQIWNTVSVEKQSVKFQGRFKTRWTPPYHVEGEPDEGPIWVQGHTYPDLDEDGNMIGASGCMFDITENKWMERMQARKVDEARDRAQLLEQLNKQQAEKAESDARFRRLADYMPLGIAIVDRDRKPYYYNKALHRLVGTDPNDPNQFVEWGTAFSDEDLPALEEQWKKGVEEKQLFTFESRMRVNHHNPDRQQWVQCCACPELDITGDPEKFILTIMDITELKDAAQIQAQRVEDVIESRKQQEQFVDMTSHEIRNPLSAIIQSTDDIVETLMALERSKTNDDERIIPASVLKDVEDALGTILYCTTHTKRIVDDILLLSKINADLLHISPEPTEVTEVVSQVLKIFQGELSASDIDWELILDQSLEQLGVDWVLLDNSRILQILVNLIGNSVKFTQFEKTRRLRVSMLASATEPSTENRTDGLTYLSKLSSEDKSISKESEDSVFISFSVEDTGCGISVAGQKTLFSRFKQGSTRTHVQYGGSGLGLFISRQLCEMMGGQMGFRSIEGKGSTFAFYVRTKRTKRPANGAALLSKRVAPMPHRSFSQTSSSNTSTSNTSIKAVDTLPSPKSESATPDTPGTDLDSTKAHILLVEDNLVNQKVVSKQLAKHGYVVKIANHGQEALDHIQKTKYWTAAYGQGEDLLAILMDVEMPVMGGKECSTRIRELQAEGAISAHIPIIGLTANARSQQIAEVIACGMDRVVSKPFRMPELLEVLRIVQADTAGSQR